MYSAKSLGRNQTYIFAEPSDDARVPSAPISPHARARAIEIGRLARQATQQALTMLVADLPHHRGRPSDVIGTITVGMARRLDLPEPEVERLATAALLHDIGKVVVPDGILDKPGPLTASEWREVVQHPRIGQLILEQSTLVRDAIPVILHHHERYSGNGYPFGLHGNAIPLGARIVAIADAYDAMTHDRPHRPAMSHAEAVHEIQRHAGSQFDPLLVTLFCDLYGEAPPMADPAIASILAAGPEARPPSPSASPAPRRRRGRSNRAAG
jgi:HD-GYP domain-containing protein (c-di-GMP phosphodiesterase class II)